MKLQNEFNPNTKPVVAIPNVDDIPNDIPICLNSFILFEYKYSGSCYFTRRA